jgi:signal transduction histidine kinase/CheY-like chemotaxis protein
MRAQLTTQFETAVIDRTNRVMYRGAIGTNLANIAVGLLVVLGNTAARQASGAWLWLSLLVTVYGLRSVFVLRFHRLREPVEHAQALRWRRIAIAGAVCGGLAWVPGIAYLWNLGDPTDRLLLGLLLSGLLAGAASILSAIPVAFIGFALPIICCVVACLVWTADSIAHVVLSISTLSLFPILLRAARTVHDEVERSIRLTLEQGSLLEDLRGARDAALAAAGARREFVAVMSHELRTPLNGVIGLTGLLLESPLTAEQRELANGSRDSAQILLGLINGVLDLSKIDAGHLELEEVDFALHEEIARLRSLFELRAKEKQLTLRVEVEPGVPERVRGDWFRLRQVLVNLLSNALKFTDHGEVTCRVTMSAPDTPLRLRFEVKDTGIGMTAAQQSRLFQPFVQADASTSRRFGGTGLGLAISKRLVALMQGELHVGSAEGGGSTFWFEVTLAAPHAPAALPPSALALSATTERRGRLLLCDDNEINLKVASRIVAKAGFEVELTRNGAEALVALAQQRFDAVLMDLQMPVLDGFQALEQARRAGSSVPFIALTASASVAEREACQRAGFSSFLTKPIDPPLLLATLGSLTKTDNKT